MVPDQYIFWAFVSAGFLTGLVIREFLSKKGRRGGFVTLCTVLFVLPVTAFSWGVVKSGSVSFLNGSLLLYSGVLFVFFLAAGFFFRAGVFFLILYVCFYFWGCWVLDGFSSEAEGECIEVTVSGKEEKPVIGQIRTFPCGISWGRVFFRAEKAGGGFPGNRSGFYGKSMDLFIRIQAFFRTVDFKLTGVKKGGVFESITPVMPVQSFYPACFRIFREGGEYIMVPVPYY